MTEQSWKKWRIEMGRRVLTLSLRAWLVGLGALVWAMPASAQSPAEIQKVVDSAYQQFRTLKEGKNADYIPALAKVDPELFGIALVTPRSESADDPLSVMFDLGQAAENMMLVAWELGIGSVPATVYEHDLARDLLGLPAGQHCEYLLSFGYPADLDDLTRPPRPGGRRPLPEMIREERW